MTNVFYILCLWKNTIFLHLLKGRNVFIPQLIQAAVPSNKPSSPSCDQYFTSTTKKYVYISTVQISRIIQIWEELKPKWITKLQTLSFCKYYSILHHKVSHHMKHRFCGSSVSVSCLHERFLLGLSHFRTFNDDLESKKKKKKAFFVVDFHICFFYISTSFWKSEIHSTK